MMNDLWHKRVITLFMIVWLAALPLGCGQTEPQAVDTPAQEHDHGEDENHDHGHDHGPAEEQENGNDHGPAEEQENGHDHGPETGDPSSASLLPYGIRVEQISPTLYSDMIKIPGTVAQAPDRQAQVSAITMVRVVTLDLPPKSTVRAGQRLAVLELADPEIRRLQLRAVELRAELLAAATGRDRTRAYLKVLQSQDEPMEVEIRRVEADLAVLEARSGSLHSELEATLSSLKVVGLGDRQLKELEEKGAVSTRIELFAPRLDGAPQMEISERPVTVGETLAAGSPIYTLVALDRLLAIGEAFEADLANVRQAARDDLPVTLFFPAEERTVPDLRVAAVEGTLDGANRVTHFLVPFPNHQISEKTVDGARYLDWENRVGARVQILVATDRSELRFVIPSSALVREAGRTALFLQEGEAFHRVFVDVESVDAGQAILPMDCGLKEGDRVVVVGALQLKLALQQQSGEGGTADGSDHGHQH
jgi:hypothetical protein